MIKRFFNWLFDGLETLPHRCKDGWDNFNCDYGTVFIWKGKKK